MKTNNLYKTEFEIENLDETGLENINLYYPVMKKIFEAIKEDFNQTGFIRVVNVPKIAKYIICNYPADVITMMLGDWETPAWEDVNDHFSYTQDAYIRLVDETGDILEKYNE